MTATITRATCTFCPDPCPHDDYIVHGETYDGDHYRARIHRRTPRCYMIDGGELRQDNERFTSLEAAVERLDEGLGGANHFRED